MSIFGPEDEKNVVSTNKYPDHRHEHGLNVQAIGRYIVWYNEAEEKYIYYSVRSRKNVDIDTGRLIEIKNGNKIESSEETSLIHTRLDSSKQLYVMLFNENVNIPIVGIGNSWSFILSINPFTDSSSNVMIITLRSEKNMTNYLLLTPQFNESRIKISYVAPGSDNPEPNHVSFYPININRMLHLSIGCESKTISLRVNGKPWHDFKLNYNHELTNASILSPAEIGILSIYNRQLSKPELIQHFIDYHVSNFTDDEVLN